MAAEETVLEHAFDSSDDEEDDYSESEDDYYVEVAHTVLCIGRTCSSSLV